MDTQAAALSNFESRSMAVGLLAALSTRNVTEIVHTYLVDSRYLNVLGSSLERKYDTQ